MELVTLYRPVGQKELDLIAATGWKRFPPRLEIQPIFYPVLTETYAIQIARDWNTKDPASGFAGYVTRFRVDKNFASRYPVQKVGGAEALEYWVPAEELNQFNDHIVPPIEVIHEFHSCSGALLPALIPSVLKRLRCAEHKSGDGGNPIFWTLQSNPSTTRFVPFNWRSRANLEIAEPNAIPRTPLLRKPQPNPRVWRLLMIPPTGVCGVCVSLLRHIRIDPHRHKVVAIVAHDRLGDRHGAREYGRGECRGGPAD